MKHNQRILLISSLVILPFTFAAFQILPNVLGPKWGYGAGFLFYWLYTLFTVKLITGFDESFLRSMIHSPRNPASAAWVNAVAFVPVIGVFFVSFLPNVAKLPLLSGTVVAVVALLNGTIEEIYWRGLYITEYKNSWRLGFFISTFLFGAWHISLWFAPHIVYQGGAVALIGGAYFMGLLWASVARSVGNIRACMVAHILVNLFAFTGLFVENGF